MIKDFVVGDTVSFSALCTKLELKVAKTGKEYGDLVLTDQSGSLVAKAWNSGFIKDVESGMVIYVENAIVGEFGGETQLTINSDCKILDDEPMMYCPRSRFTIDSMLNSLVKIMESVKDPWCEKIIERCFDDKHIMSNITSSSAAVAVHHNFVGGLLEHTLYVTRMCELAANVYTWVNRDLLVTAAFLHDMGKIDEISPFPENQYTDFGGYVGHVVGSAMLVDRYCRDISGFPEDIRFKLVHCMLAHHGKLEYGSPKLPSIPEAFILSQIDNLDAKLKIFESEIPATGWSSFNRYLDTRISSGAFNNEAK